MNRALSHSQETHHYIEQKLQKSQKSKVRSDERKDTAE
jgi:hypothetical protein